MCLKRGFRWSTADGPWPVWSIPEQTVVEIAFGPILQLLTSITAKTSRARFIADFKTVRFGCLARILNYRIGGF